jgi:hypothetical protein
MLRLGAIILDKLHVHRFFNTPGGYVVDPISMRLCGISNKYTIKRSRFKFSNFATFNVNMAFASKDSKVRYIWLFTGEEFIWCHVLERTEEEPV